MIEGLIPGGPLVSVGKRLNLLGYGNILNMAPLTPRASHSYLWCPLSLSLSLSLALTGRSLAQLSDGKAPPWGNEESHKCRQSSQMRSTSEKEGPGAVGLAQAPGCFSFKQAHLGHPGRHSPSHGCGAAPCSLGLAAVPVPPGVPAD